MPDLVRMPRMVDRSSPCFIRNPSAPIHRNPPRVLRPPKGVQHSFMHKRTEHAASKHMIVYFVHAVKRTLRVRLRVASYCRRPNGHSKFSPEGLRHDVIVPGIWSLPKRPQFCEFIPGTSGASPLDTATSTRWNCHFATHDPMSQSARSRPSSSPACTAHTVAPIATY